MPTRTLPNNPSLDHLKHQAKDLLDGHRERRPDVLQRIREFHPDLLHADDEKIAGAPLKLADAQRIIAREYGFLSWVRLRTQVAKRSQDWLNLPYHERIEDAAFRRAVDLLDAGDADRLRKHLAAHPALAHQRVRFEGGNYFQNPSLLEFVAENPIRRGRLPANIVEIARIILEAGAKSDRSAINEATGLVGSGKVPREQGVQESLIDLLCSYGAEPDAAIGAALAHGEFGAVNALIRNGAKIDLKVAAAIGDFEAAEQRMGEANGELRHWALAFAAAFGHADIVVLLAKAGEDLNRYNPPGAHSHSTPMHQAALANHAPVLKVLVDHGAKLNPFDILFHGTPLDWAMHGNANEAAEYLRSVGAKTANEM